MPLSFSSLLLGLHSTLANSPTLSFHCLSSLKSFPYLSFSRYNYVSICDLYSSYSFSAFFSTPTRWNSPNSLFPLYSMFMIPQNNFHTFVCPYFLESKEGTSYDYSLRPLIFSVHILLNVNFTSQLYKTMQNQRYKIISVFV